MILFVSGLTGDWAKHYMSLSEDIGFLVTPSGGHLPGTVLANCKRWAADNDCFNGFDEPAYVKMLERWRGVQPGPWWISVPDVVADAAATMQRFEEWEPKIHAMGFPVALVAQDGLESMVVPWSRFEALFIGGSTEFKLSDDVRALCAEAKMRGKLVHMGRVNTLRRMETAARWGVDSIDGSGFSRWKKLIPRGIRWLNRAQWLAQNQPLMFD